MKQNLPAPTDTFVTLTMERFFALPTKVLQAIECAGIQTWTRNGFVLVGVSIAEFDALLKMWPATADTAQPKTFAAQAGEA